jgi:HK97 family phage major capsid protein
MRFTLFMLLIATAMLNMPTNVYQICAWNHGTENTAPWRSTSKKPLLRERVRSMMTQLRDWCAQLTDIPILCSEAGIATADLLTGGQGARIAALRQRGGAINAAIDKIADAVTARGVLGVMTEAERTELSALKTAKTETAQMLADAEEAARNAPPTANADVDAGIRASSVALGKDRKEDDPKRGFKDHREFLSAVMVAGSTNRVDERLKPLRATQGTDEQQGSQDPYGGYLIPHGVAPGILSITPEDDPLAGRVREVPMTTPSVSYNARVDKDHSSSVSGGLVVTRKPETVDASSSRMKFEQVRMQAHARWGLAFATEEILQDSPESFVAIIAAGFGDEYNAKTLDERLNGSGVGEPLGVLHANNGCLVTVSAEGGQAPDTILKENIDKMSARVWRPSKAVWLANHDTRPQLKSLVQVVGAGGNSVPYLTGSEGNEFLDGKPIYFTEFASKLGDVGDLILGNWSEYLWGSYQPLKSDESIHVRFAAGERCFRFYDRNDGQPWWKTALTPKKSAQTLSPFVVLAAR